MATKFKPTIKPIHAQCEQHGPVWKMIQRDGKWVRAEVIRPAVDEAPKQHVWKAAMTNGAAVRERERERILREQRQAAKFVLDNEGHADVRGAILGASDWMAEEVLMEDEGGSVA